MSFSNFLEQKILEFILANGGGTLSAYSSWVALCTAAQLDTGIANELSGNGYTRKQATWNSASGGQITNSNTITFGPATANWTQVTHFYIMSESAVGNSLAWGALTTPKTVQTDDTAVFAAGALTINLD